jgi:hypothetical protein
MMKKEYLYGVTASVLLFSAYLIILTALQGFSHAIEEFISLWYLMGPIVVGFGVQVSLFYHIKKLSAAVGGGVAACGGVSTSAMIACCAHHVSDVLPIIGLSAATLFLTKYQVSFLTLGLFSNLIGIITLLNIIQKHRPERTGLFRYNMRKIRNITSILSVLIVAITFVGTAYTGAAVETETFNLPTLINDVNGVAIEVTPLEFDPAGPFKFDLAINTHQGSLDFDMTEISILEDDNGNSYSPIRWEGSPPGGHHRYGVLVFPAMEETTNMRLTINDVYGVPERTFDWDLE